MGSREEALHVLIKVYRDQAFPNVVLKGIQSSELDQGFITALVYTTLQNDSFLWYQYHDLIKTKPALEIELILKMSLAQAFFMDKIPDYALVNEAVDLAKKYEQGRASGFVNATLKKVLARGRREVEVSGLEDASLRYSMPMWILRILAKQYGETFAIAYAKQCLEVAPSYVRFNPRDDLSAMALRDHLVERDGSYYRAQPGFFKTDFLRQGKALIQDKGSQRVVEVMAPQPGSLVLDGCAAPGTKSLYISDVMKDEGCLVALDVSEVRLHLVELGAQRWRAQSIMTVCEDICTFSSNRKFDQILIDAPCSGLGVLRHKPDMKWRLRPENLDELQVLQARILQHVAQFVTSQGELIYSTCTLNRKENERQIEKFLANNPEFSLLQEVWVDPLEENCDGFYIAKCKRA